MLRCAQHAQGFLFEHAGASNPVTQPSHSTILTGTYPLVHGVLDRIHVLGEIGIL